MTDPVARDRNAAGAGSRNVVVLTTTFPIEPGDGTPEFVLTLAESFKGWNVTVVTPRVRGARRRDRFGTVDVVRVRYLPAGLETVAADAILPAIRSNPWRLLELPFLLPALVVGSLTTIRRTRADVVNAHWISPAGVIALLARRLFSVPFVLTVHGADAYALNGALVGWLKRRVLASAAAVAPVSRDIRSKLHLQNSEVLPMGVDGSALREEMGPRRPGTGLVVMIGRLADKKGFDVAVRAAADVPGVRLEIIGSGPEEQHLRQLVDRLELTDRVEFRGKCPRPEVLDALARASVVAIPSVVGAGGDMEGTPVVLCEAMSAGVPVIASALGGLGEHLHAGSSGLLVPPGDVDALAAAFRSVADGNVDIDGMGKSAREYAARHLDIHAIADSYDRLLGDAAAGLPG